MKNLFSKVAARGWWYALAIVFNRVVPEPIFRFRYFHVYQLGQIQSAASTTADVQIRRCTDTAELQAVSELTRWDHLQSSGSDVMPSAWRASIKRESAAGLWLASGRFCERELGICYDLRHDQQWLFAAYVETRYRGQGIYGKLLSQVLADSRAMHTLVAINPVNRLSLAAHRRAILSGRASGRPIGKCLALRCFTFSAAWSFGELHCDRHVTLSNRRRPISIRIETNTGYSRSVQSTIVSE